MKTQKTILITAESGFHPGLEVRFRVPAEVGAYSRRCPKACDDKRINGVQVHCGCGFPVARTNLTTPSNVEAHIEWAKYGAGVVVCIDRILED